MNNIILCVKWGDKYGREYVEKLKQQCEEIAQSLSTFTALPITRQNLTTY